MKDSERTSISTLVRTCDTSARAVRVLHATRFVVAICLAAWPPLLAWLFVSSESFWLLIEKHEAYWILILVWPGIPISYLLCAAILQSRTILFPTVLITIGFFLLLPMMPVRYTDDLTWSDYVRFPVSLIVLALIGVACGERWSRRSVHGE